MKSKFTSASICLYLLITLLPGLSTLAQEPSSSESPRPAGATATTPATKAENPADPVSSDVAANPFLPLWEHIPDGEPRVFEDPDIPGKYRVYIYGSHDTSKTSYCGTDLVVWSAPLEDLSNWRYDGVIYQNLINPDRPGVLFAPDVVEVKKGSTKKYYLYPNEQGAKNANVAVSDSPKGPFVRYRKNGDLGFDPAVLVDDDGRVYGYWGYKKSFGAELDPDTMCTVKSGTTIKSSMVSSITEDTSSVLEVQKNSFRFFEGSSIRKVGNIYVFVYARTAHSVEGGDPSLAYAYSTGPLGPWTYGGIIIRSGSNKTYPMGNIHGSILNINNHWYVFYHRQTNNNLFARQACVEPIDVRIESNKVVIQEVEATSSGFNVNGLNPYKKYSAGHVCYLTTNGAKSGAYVAAEYDQNVNSNHITNVLNNTVAGFKYFNFDRKSTGNEKTQVELDIVPKGVAGTIDVMLDSPTTEGGGTRIGGFTIGSTEPQAMTKLITDVAGEGRIYGKHAVYFVFKSTEKKPICDVYYLKFSIAK